MTITHEVPIDLRWSWIIRRRAALIHTFGYITFGYILKVVLFYFIAVLLIAILELWTSASTERVPVAAMFFAGVFILTMGMIGLGHRRANKAAEKRLGPILTQFVEFNDAGVTYGTRHCSHTHLHWDLCKIVWKKDQLDIHVGGVMIPISLSVFQPQEIEQVRYWSTRHQCDVDLCPHCQYDLQASPGPQCPECGKPIRLREII